MTESEDRSQEIKEIKTALLREQSRAVEAAREFREGSAAWLRERRLLNRTVATQQASLDSANRQLDELKSQDHAFQQREGEMRLQLEDAKSEVESLNTRISQERASLEELLANKDA